MPHINFPKTPRFTLIELLLVISILVLLASLLMPALISAKNKAKEIFCLNNGKEISLIIHLFATDHNSQIKPSFKGKPVYDLDMAYRAYITDAKVFDCPSKDEADAMYLIFNENLAICEYAVFSPFSIDDAYNLDTGVFSPSSVRLVGEAVPPAYGYYWISEIVCPWNISARWRHGNNNLMNVIFADGSGEAERIIEPPIPSRPGYPPYIR